jgi:hypothetical protein
MATTVTAAMIPYSSAVMYRPQLLRHRVKA